MPRSMLKRFGRGRRLAPLLLFPALLVSHDRKHVSMREVVVIFASWPLP